MSYEEEYKRLEDWYWKQKDEINDLTYSGLLDGERSEYGAKLNRELTERLRVLKEEYSVK